MMTVFQHKIWRSALVGPEREKRMKLIWRKTHQLFSSDSDRGCPDQDKLYPRSPEQLCAFTAFLQHRSETRARYSSTPKEEQNPHSAFHACSGAAFRGRQGCPCRGTHAGTALRHRYASGAPHRLWHGERSWWSQLRERTVRRGANATDNYYYSKTFL